MDSGSTENKMALELTPLHLERPNKDNGKKENALIGSELQNSKVRKIQTNAIFFAKILLICQAYSISYTHFTFEFRNT